MFQTAFNPLSTKNRYSIPPILRPPPSNPQAAFSQRPKGSPHETSTHPRPAAGRHPVRPSRAAAKGRTAALPCAEKPRLFPSFRQPAHHQRERAKRAIPRLRAHRLCDETCRHALPNHERVHPRSLFPRRQHQRLDQKHRADFLSEQRGRLHAGRSGAA